MRKGGTILYIGDSIGWASNVTLKKGTDLFTGKIRDAIRANYGACKLINKGIGGSFTDTVVSNHSWIFNLESPDLIMFSIGTNDCTGGTKPIATFKADLEKTLDEIKSKFPDAHLILCLPPRTLDSNRSPYIQSFRTAMVEVATPRNLDVCHFENAWTSADDSTHIESDNIHPNATGQTALFNELWMVVQNSASSWLSELEK